jgi:hypothetical protein
LIRTLDDDWYKINVKKGYGIYAEISFNDAQGDLDLYLISENNTLLAWGNLTDSDLENFTAYEAQAAGWYYIVVKQSNETHNDYDLLIDIGPYEEVLKRHPTIEPVEPPEKKPKEEEDKIFGIPVTIVVISTGGIALGGGLGGSALVLKKKGKFPFKKKGSGGLPFDESK